MPSAIGHFEKVRALASQPRLIAVGGVRAGAASQIVIFDHVADTVKHVLDLDCHVLCLAFGKDALYAGGADGKVRIIDAVKGSVTKTVKAHEGAVTSIFVQGEMFATAGADGHAKLFSLEGKGQGDHTLSGRPLRAVAIDPTGESLAAAGDDGVVRMVTLENNTRRDMSGHDGGVTCLTFTPADGRLVSGGEDGTIRIWYLVGDVESDVRGKDESGHAGGVAAVMFAPAKEATDVGERLVSAGMDGNIRVWRMSEKRKPRTLEAGGAPICALAFCPGNKTFGAIIAAGDDRTVYAYVLEPTGAPTDKTLKFPHGFALLDEGLSAQARPKREETVKKLASLDEVEALELALKALQSDRDAEVRALAATELAAKGRRDARQGLRGRLDDEDAKVRKAAFEALRSLEADVPLSPLRAGLDSKFPNVRVLAVRALGEMAKTSPLAAGLVAARIADADAGVRRAALAELVRIHPAKTVEPLRIGFDRGPADVRAEVIVRGALDDLVKSGGLETIVGRALDDEDADVRRLAFVVKVLATPALSAWLEPKDESFGRAVTDLCRRAVQLEGASGEPTQAELDGARGKLVKKGSASSVPGEQEREPLLAALACRKPDTALRGARALAILSDMRALGALLTISREPAPELRRDAANALAQLDDPRAKKRLVWMLSDADAAVRDAALGCLGKLEKQPLDLAESALRSAQEDVRVRGLDVLVKQGKGQARAEALLGESLEDEASKVRGEAFRTLWSWHEGDPLVPIDRALIARFPDVRTRAVSELEGMATRKESGALERLVKTIGDRDATVAKTAYEAAVKIKGKEDPEAHLAAMASTHASMRTEGAKGAQKTKPEPVRSALMKQIADEDQSARTQALETLDKLLPTEGGPMYAGLQSSFLDLRVRAAELLAVRRDEQLIDPMRALLMDKELKLRIPEAILVPLRRRAATALASLGSTKLLKYFATDLLKDEDPIVREQGARGLSNASRRGEEGYLLDALGHEEIAVRSWAAEGLARLGDVRALPVLTGTLRHEHPPIRVGAILSFAALGPEGYGGLLQGLEDPSRDVQHIVLTIVLARDLRAFRRGESPDLLTSALSSQRPEVRFAAARALELRIEPDGYLDHLVEVLLPPKPEKAADMANWPSEEQRAAILVGLAEALAGERPEQRYAAAQALRLRERPIDYFREAQRAVRPRSTTAPWVPETTPRGPEPAPEKPRPGPLAILRKLFASGATEDAQPAAEPKVPTDEQKRLRMVAFGAYVGLLRQAGEDEESHRVRRDAIDRIVDLAMTGHITVGSATPALARALDDPNHLVRKAAFVALKKVYEKDPETPLALALASDASDVARGALDELLARGESAKPRIASALNSKIPDARKYAFELLERLSPKGSLEPLLAALSSEHADVRIGVLERLSTSQDPRVAQALGKALESDHDDLRLRAAEMLAARKDDRCADVLAGLLRDPDAGITERTIEALVRLGSAKAVSAIASRIEDPAPDDARLALCNALGRFRVPEAVTTLAARLADEIEGIRAAAFEACLAVIGPRSDAKRERGAPAPRRRDAKLAAKFLDIAARAKHADVRIRAARELDELDDASAEPLLLGLFGDRDTQIRAAAVESYAKRVDKKGAPTGPLEDVLRAGARETMLAAAEGLASKQIGTAFRGLLLYVRAGEDGQRERALLALGTLGDPRALPELEIVVAGGTEEAPVEPPMQAAALEALGRLFGKLKDADEKERIRDRVEANVGAKDQGLAVAAVKGLRWMGGERSRARLEGVMLSRQSSSPERVTAAEVLGEMKDVAAEPALAKALSDYDDDLRFTAREALEKLFPNERTRIELHAVSSDYDDISGPAATFLATEGDAGELLARIATLRDEGLRERLRYGLVRRPSIPRADLEKLLEDGNGEARADAAWLVGARSTKGHAHGDLATALAEATRKAEKRWAELKKSGDDDVHKEERAWVLGLWALRRVGRGDAVTSDARKWIAKSELPIDVRTQAAHALGEHGSDADAKVLVATLGAADPALRSAAASALATRGHEAASIKGLVDPVMLTIIASKGEQTFDTTAERKIHLPRAIKEGVTDGLLDLAREGSGQDRLDAIAALGRLATNEATELLEELAFDKEGTKEDIRKAAYRSLRRAKRISEKKEAAP